jgi:hypothetical protein
VDPELVFILFAVFIILLRKILEGLFEKDEIKLGVLFGFPTSILSFFFLSFILASGETSLTFIERVGYMIDLGDPATNIIRCSIAGFAAFIVGCIGGIFVTNYVDKNPGELERNLNIMLGVIVFGLFVGGPCAFVALLCASNS